MTTLVHQTLARRVDIRLFKNLLENISFARPDISIRLQMKNQPWPLYFSSIMVFEKHAIMFVHMHARTVISVPDVHAFEIDQPHKEFWAFRPYSVSHVNSNNLA